MGIVNEHTVQAGEGGDSTHVRPGERAVQERELRNAKVTNDLVEGGNVRRTRRAGVLLFRIPDEIKVPGQQPGAMDVWQQLTQAVEEEMCVLVVSGCIHICDGEAQVHHSGGQNSGERVFSSNEGIHVEKVWVPGSQDPSPSTRSAQKVV